MNLPTFATASDSINNEYDPLLTFAINRGAQVLEWGVNPLHQLKRFPDRFEFATKRSSVVFELNHNGESPYVYACWIMRTATAAVTVVNEDELFCEADVVGWLSSIKSTMMNAGTKRLSALFQGRNIFPEGTKGAAHAFTESAQVFSNFRIGPQEAIDAICKEVKPRYSSLWQVTDNNAWALPLDGVGVGALVARDKGDIIKWRIHVPFGGLAVDFRGEFATPEDKSRIPDILLHKMVRSIVVGYLSREIPTHSLPSTWRTAITPFFA